MTGVFEVSLEDVATVLRNNKEFLRTTNGMPLREFAELLMNDIDFDRVEASIIKSGVHPNDKTKAAHAEIKKILIDNGVIARITLH